MASAGCLGALGHRGTRPGKVQYFGDFNCEIHLHSPPSNVSIQPFEPISGKVVISTRRELTCYGLKIQLDAIVKLSLNKRSDGGGGAKGIHRKMAGLFDDCCDTHEGITLLGLYIDSPVQQHLLISKIRDGIYEKVIIPPGTHNYPFNLSMPDESMPRQFSTPNGLLKYQIAIYMLAYPGPFGIQVPVCEKPVKFKGYYNLSTNPEITLEGINLQKTFNRSMFSSKKVITILISVDQTGFLPGEDIPFTMKINNPKCYSIFRISGNLVTRVTYNVNGITSTTVATLDTVEIDVADGIGKAEVETLNSKFSIPKNCIPTFKKPGKEVYTVVHSIQFQLVVDGYSAPLKCQADVIIGTTRESAHDLMLRGQQETLDPGSTIHRSDSMTSVLSDTASRITINSFSLPPPPNYSQLTSRASSMYSIETLPPNFEDLNL